jgi:hypothetical protein
MDFAYPKCKNILIDVQSKPYRDEVVRYLDLIATTDVGQTLYKFIAQTTKSARITWTLGDHWLTTGAKPVSKSDVERVAKSSIKIERERGLSEEAALDAAISEDAIISQKLRGQYAKGHPVMKEIRFSILEMLGLHSTFMVPTNDVGTGLGADVELNYHPAAFRQMIKNTGRVGIGFGPGEYLYHELVHALRTMAGLYLDENVPERLDMDNFEEFCAILAANIYRSARGFTRLRLDHHVANEKTPWTGATELPPALSDPRRYFEHFKPQIVKWFNNQRPFCVALAESCAPFNPMAIAAGDLGIPVAKC